MRTLRVTLLLWVTVLVASLVPSVGAAQAYDHALRLEAGLGLPVGSPVAERFDAGGGLGLGYELRFLPFLGAEAHHGSFFFPTTTPTPSGYGAYHGLGLGLRLHPIPDLDAGDLYAAARGAIVFTGDVVRPGLEVDVGFEFALSSSFRFGPFIRYAHAFQTDGAELALGQGDGTFLIIGLSGALTFGGEEAAPVDTDRDGSSDDVDRCPNEPEDVDGYEDEDGCPDTDDDADGVPDADDSCPREAEDRDGFQDEDGCPDPDNDGDGIADGDDQCPNEAEDMNGQADEDGCPDAGEDSDGDGVPDVSDQCPEDPEDRDGFADEDGCPDPDNDGDGVLDGDDDCPTAPGHVDNGGCPQAVRVEGTQIRILQRIEFDVEHSTIRRRSYPILEEVAAALQANPQIRRLRIEGHTDNRGDEEYNRELSQQRAQRVLEWLVENGVAAERLQAEGVGPSRPLEDNETRAGRQANRRVEFHIVQ
ncbi:MAG: hypothetical protein SangKO_020020 [Sandaracinaceae bacterium]